MTDDQSPTVVLLNAYSAQNVGDWLLVEASLALISDRHPHEAIVVVALDPQSFISRSLSAPVIEAPFSLAKSRLAAIPGYLLALLTACRCGPPRLKRLRAIDSAYSVGGGFLQIRGRRELASVGLAHLTQIMLMRRLRVPIVMLPQSIGPFRGRLNQRLARRILNAFAVVVLRENLSLAYVRGLGTNDAAAVVTAPDLAFWATRNRGTPPRHAKVSLSGGPTDPKCVALVARQWSFPGSHNPPRAYDTYIATFARLADLLLDRGHSVVMVAQSTGPTTRGDDRVAAAEIRKRMRQQLPKVVDLRGRASIDTCEEVYASFDVVVSTRLHGALMALRAGVPAVAIGYEWKSDGIFGALGLEDWHRPIGSWTEHGVADLLENLSAYPMHEVQAKMRRLDAELKYQFLTRLPILRRHA